MKKNKIYIMKECKIIVKHSEAQGGKKHAKYVKV